ncbi:uncharacterized protein LOC105698398 isoform X2 [Orussus abietinus]|uniref:uncharacterized protein LOC105698398 isoform X2 n=1 Tax=Orussus abietinus TaxID=222816 RepID=UPI000625D130|nr:uncharacterized protein LOC105698398 isoform X2 [Orussus abietinus]
MPSEIELAGPRVMHCGCRNTGWPIATFGPNSSSVGGYNGSTFGSAADQEAINGPPSGTPSLRYRSPRSFSATPGGQGETFDGESPVRRRCTRRWRTEAAGGARGEGKLRRRWYQGSSDGEAISEEVKDSRQTCREVLEPQVLGWSLGDQEQRTKEQDDQKRDVQRSSVDRSRIRETELDIRATFLGVRHEKEDPSGRSFPIDPAQERSVPWKCSRKRRSSILDSREHHEGNPGPLVDRLVGSRSGDPGWEATRPKRGRRESSFSSHSGAVPDGLSGEDLALIRLSGVKFPEPRTPRSGWCDDAGELVDPPDSTFQRSLRFSTSRKLPRPSKGGRSYVQLAFLLFLLAFGHSGLFGSGVVLFGPRARTGLCALTIGTVIGGVFGAPVDLIGDAGVRAERSANLSHITGASRKIQMYIKNRHLQILPDGTVNGSNDDTSDYTIFQRTSVSRGQLRIQGVATCLFLCMDSCGLLYSSREYTDDCVFNETLEQHNYNTYSSARWSTPKKTLFLGLNRHGQPRRVQTKGHNLGRLSAYARVLTQVAPPDRVEALQRKLMGAQHGVRHRHNNGHRHHGQIQQAACPNLPAQDKDGRDRFRCRKRKKRKKKRRKCREGEKPGPHCEVPEESYTYDGSGEGPPESKRSCEGAASEEACRMQAFETPSKKRKSRIEEKEEEDGVHEDAEDEEEPTEAEAEEDAIANDEAREKPHRHQQPHQRQQQQQQLRKNKAQWHQEKGSSLEEGLAAVHQEARKCEARPNSAARGLRLNDITVVLVSWCINNSINGAR